jgi:hypothetical protein
MIMWLPIENAVQLRFRLAVRENLQRPLGLTPKGAPEVDQDWQSAAGRGVSFFSAAYLAAVVFTKGLMIC